MRHMLFEFIFNRRPSVYAIIYLLIIPIFAFFYALIPSDFYHSTAKFEYPVVNFQADEILEDFKVLMTNNYKYYKLSKTKDSIDREPEIEDISASSLRYQNHTFYLQICLSTYFKFKPSDPSMSYSHGCYDVSFPRKILMRTIDTKNHIQTITRQFKVENVLSAVDSTYFESGIINHLLNSSSNIPNGLVINDQLNSKLIEFAQTINGFPTTFSENYWRMFYFSAVTITTVGYGDIVPISNRARAVISIEAILGVVLIGLFLNSLSKRMKA